MKTVLKSILFLATAASSFVIPESGSPFLHKVKHRDVKLHVLDEFITSSMFGAAVFFTVTKADQYDEEVRAELFNVGAQDEATESDVEEDVNEGVEEAVVNEVEEVIEEPPKATKKVAISSKIDVSLKKSVASTIVGEKQKQDRLKASEKKEPTKGSAPSEPVAVEKKQEEHESFFQI